MPATNYGQQQQIVNLFGKVNQNPSNYYIGLLPVDLVWAPSTTITSGQVSSGYYCIATNFNTTNTTACRAIFKATTAGTTSASAQPTDWTNGYVYGSTGATTTFGGTAGVAASGLTTVTTAANGTANFPARGTITMATTGTTATYTYTGTTSNSFTGCTFVSGTGNTVAGAAITSVASTYTDGTVVWTEQAYAFYNLTSGSWGTNPEVPPANFTGSVRPTLANSQTGSTWSTATTTASSTSVSWQSTISFGTSAATWKYLAGYILYDASTGGNAWHYGLLNSYLAVLSSGISVSIPNTPSPITVTLT